MKREAERSDLLPPKTQLSIKGMVIQMKGLPPILPGCGIRNLVKNYKKNIKKKNKEVIIHDAG